MLRPALLTLVAAAGLPAPAPASAALTARPVRLVVPFPPGGPTDIAARTLATELSVVLARTVVTDNRPGAAGLIAAQTVAAAAPDGHTLLFSGAGAFGINPALFSGRLPYDPKRDFTPVVLVISSPNLITAHLRFAGQTVADLIRIARDNPGRLNVGVGSLGTTQHMAIELMKTMTGVRVTIVPYKGAAPAMQDLIGGNLDILSDGIASSLPQVRAGRIRALAVTSPARVPIAGDIPAVAETLPGFSAVAWFGLFGPARMPSSVAEALNRAVNRALGAEAVRARYEQAAIQVLGGTPGQAAAQVQSELGRWAEVVRVTGAKVE